MQGPDGAVDSREGLGQTTLEREVEEMEMRLDLFFKTLLCQLLNVHTDTWGFQSKGKTKAFSDSVFLR